MAAAVIIWIFFASTFYIARASQMFVAHGLPKDFTYIGGRMKFAPTAAPGEVPWHVSIQNVEGYQMCSGAIISEDWILTVAHCSINPHSYYRVIAGTNENAEPRSVHLVEEIHMAKWNSGTNENDISVWKVSPSFMFDAFTGPVRIPNRGAHNPMGTIMTVSAWGGGSSPKAEEPDSSDVLLKIELLLQSQEYCDGQYQYYGGIFQHQMCVGLPPSHHQGYCNSDAGSPLVKDGIVYGLSSWGIGCAMSGYPAVYTDVSAYSTWIKLITEVSPAEYIEHV